ncbi:MAG: pyridoxamine 5'-phosphate oxidase family protein [Promethearchaeota archaeon]
MNEREMKVFCNKFMEEEKTACFTTIDENGYPHTRGIFNLRNVKQFPTLYKVFEKHQEDLTIYISTNTSSSKVQHIKTNKKVSVCILDSEKITGVTFGGEIEIITDKKIKKDLWLDWWVQYYPKGENDEDYTILRLKPKTVEIWYKGKYKFQLE